MENGTIPKGYILYNNNFTLISPIYTFPWRDTKLFTRQIKVQIGKSTLIIIFIKERERCRLWREINTFSSISSLTDRVFPIFQQETGTVRSVRDGHQSGYSRADTINKNINKDQSHFHTGNKYNNTVVFVHF